MLLSSSLPFALYRSFLVGILFILSLPSLPYAAGIYDPFSAGAVCPSPCPDTADHGGWALYRDVKQLGSCNQTVLLEVNLSHGDESNALPVPVRACSAPSSAAPAKRQSFSFGPASSSETKDIHVVRWHGQGSSSGASLAAATSALANAVKVQKNGTPTILLVKSGDVIVGVYAGSEIENTGLASIIQQFAAREASHQAAQTAAQLCDETSLGTQIIGIFVDTTGQLDPVRSALSNWNDAACVRSGDETDTWAAVTIATVPGTSIPVGPAAGDSGSDGLAKRATCTYTQAVANDGCWSLADRCHITQAQLISYNNDTNLCNNIKVNQYICCNAGSPPDFSPKPNADGSCKSYTVQSGDYCAAIAAANSITVTDIENRNNNTWGWTGCGYLLVGEIICLSTGSPPMPGAISNAMCGPQVPGTQRPANMSTLAGLNPCPLSVCCNVWGQCGITKDFCVPSPANTGAPGTATPGSNGCVSSCGMTITNNASPPPSFKRVGYWEAWNGNRPCLHMRVRISRQRLVGLQGKKLGY